MCSCAIFLLAIDFHCRLQSASVGSAAHQEKFTMPQRPAMTPRRLFQEENAENENENDTANRINYSNDNAANVFLEELAKSRAEAKARWNFDFVKEEPLEGAWEWERLTPKPATNSTTEGSQENNQNATNTQGCA